MQQNRLTTFFIVRHAETEHNVKGIVGANPHLTENGKMQAKILAEEFANKHFDCVYTSELFRTKETAQIIAKDIAAPFIPTKEINERNYGIYEGKPIAEYESDLKNVIEKMRKMSDEELYIFRRYESCETDSEMMDRFIKFLKKTAHKHQERNILVVTHGILMRAFLIKIKYATYKNLPSNAIENTAYVKIKSDGSNFRVIQGKGISRISNH